MFFSFEVEDVFVAPVLDVGFPFLAIEAAQRGVVVDRRLLDVVEIVGHQRVLVDDGEAEPAGREVLPAGVFEPERERIQERIHHQPADRIARIGGPEHGQHQIKSLAHSPDRKRLPEILVVGLEVDVLGHVEQAAEAGRGVHRGATDRDQRTPALSLHQVVGENRRALQVLQEVVDDIAHVHGHVFVVKKAHRSQQQVLQDLVEVEDHAVHRFQRIAHLGDGDRGFARSQIVQVIAGRRGGGRRRRRKFRGDGSRRGRSGSRRQGRRSARTRGERMGLVEEDAHVVGRVDGRAFGHGRKAAGRHQSERHESASHSSSPPRARHADHPRSPEGRNSNR